MGCFFPAIFKKNTYKRVKFFILSLVVLGFVFLFSGCKIARSVVSAPFKAVGWSATKISEVVEGKKVPGEVENLSESPVGPVIDASDPASTSHVDLINLDFIVIYGILVLGIAIIVRSLVYRYVLQDTKE